MVTIGIDPHKASHTAVALDPSGETLGELRVVADASMLAPPAAVGVGLAATDVGDRGRRRPGTAARSAARRRRARRVVDVPSALAARARVLARGHGRKTDGIDARSVALVAQHRSDLLAVAADDHTAVLRLLSDRRDELTGERRRTDQPAAPRCCAICARAAPRGSSRPIGPRACSTAIRPAGAVDLERKAIARQLIADVRRIDRALLENRRRCEQAVASSGSTLTEIFGISDVLAAKILGHTGDITRFASADHYASYTGTAPVEASSGEQTRH